MNAEGSNTAKNAAVLVELARLVASGDLEVPIAAIFSLDDVRAAIALLEKGHTSDKIVDLTAHHYFSNNMSMRGAARSIRHGNDGDCSALSIFSIE